MRESNLSAFIWSVADRLRGDFKQADYGILVNFTDLYAELRERAKAG